MSLVAIAARAINSKGISMFGFNPYVLIGVLVFLLSMAGVIGYQSHEIHKYHVMYETELKVEGAYKQQVIDMTTSQNTQSTKTQETVTKVVKVPVETQRIVTEVQKVTVPSECKTPDYPQDVKDSF